ncbi:MAG: LamG-like jellyroll fold domain-containing protein [Candidatus Brocadiia bacterium]
MRVITLLATALLMAFASLTAGAEDYSWQKPHAKVIETGDLQWRPEPFEFEAGDSIRYIDYENGDDANDGATKGTPWKHHPWDTRAEGNAAAASGPITYVFKRGVHYRIYSYEGEEALWRARDSGEPGNPIRLTSDPEWGSGEAVIAGSRPITGQWKKASATDAPDRLDTENQTVWYLDVKRPLQPDGRRGRMQEMVLYVVDEAGEIYDLHLASDVGWGVTNPNFAMHHWNTWDEYRPRGKGGGPYQDDDLKGYPEDYFEGGTIWSQYAWVIANPTPDPKPLGEGDYDPEKGTLRYKDGADPVNPGTRYLIENLPQFLDQPGEFYYDKQAGRLFVRLRGDHDPNTVRIELATAYDTLEITNRSHIEVSGLTFRFNGRNPFPQSSNVIEADGNCTNITIKNCRFEHIANDAIWMDVQPDEVMDYISVRDCDFNWVNGGTAVYMRGSAGKPKGDQKLGRLVHAELMRNRVRNAGLYRHDDHRWSNVAALSCLYPVIGEMAGNIVDTTWGSGLVSQGGATGKSPRGYDLPLGRILFHHNKTQYNALGVNDYGGISLWQHGPMYSFSNIVGNSVGHWPGGFYNGGDVNLSYPIYLDGGFKIYNFNNISWARPYDEDDPYTSTSSAYFNVFGYMNPFVNNTIYGSGTGFGGTSGNRNDYLGNIIAAVRRAYISVNHGGNPSLIGGDDTAESGIDGATTLAYADNVFHGGGKAGVVATTKRGARKDIQADDLDTLARQMREYPLRMAQVGVEAETMPVAEPIPADQEKPDASDADFRPAPGSPAIDRGVEYLIPWALYATVGEWHFNANHADPKLILDYHYYPTPAYFNRKMYYRVPVHELEAGDASLDDYTESPSEDWVDGALVFNGSRQARVPHEKMARDIVFDPEDIRVKAKELPPAPWQSRDGRIIYPGEERKTLDIKTTNLLVETILRTESGHVGGVIAGKHDGETGYGLFVGGRGRAVFEVASDGQAAGVATADPINDGEWHHLLAEIDRETGRMSIYLDGKLSAEAKANSLPAGSSLSNTADFIVGTDHAERAFFEGAIDFLRVAQGTLADAETDIAELYEWQTNGPVKYDFAGNPPVGRRDAGALERVE